MEHWNNHPRLILGIGELLWDIPANGAGTVSSARSLGGAPANFAVMAGRLGNRAAILSRIGRDNAGREAIEQLERVPVEAGFLQVDPAHETGRVTVRFEDGQPRYTIHQPAAWDFLELSDEWISLAERADAICFGSLAQRHAVSRQTIQTLISEARQDCLRVFDLNLRAPFYSGETIQESLDLATVLRANEAEFVELLDLLGLAGAEAGVRKQLRAGAQEIFAAFPSLAMVALTRGSHGSLLVTREGWNEHPGFATRVVDTIGAGDAFTAALTHYLLRGAGLAKLNEAGNRWAAWVASQAGGMPQLHDAVRDEITAAIERSKPRRQH